MTPPITCRPCNPVMLRKVKLKAGTPHGLPASPAPSAIRCDHSYACRQTKIAPATAVADTNRTAAARCLRRIMKTESAINVLLKIRIAVITATSRMLKISARLGHAGALNRAAQRATRSPANVIASEARKSHIISLPQLTSHGDRPPAQRAASDVPFPWVSVAAIIASECVRAGSGPKKQREQ